jgi:hypothetical protein
MQLGRIKDWLKIENPLQVHDKMGIFKSTVGFNRIKHTKPVEIILLFYAFLRESEAIESGFMNSFSIRSFN